MHICEFYSGLTLEILLRVNMATIKDEITIKLCMVDLVGSLVIHNMYMYVYTSIYYCGLTHNILWMSNSMKETCSTI